MTRRMLLAALVAGAVAWAPGPSALAQTTGSPSIAGQVITGQQAGQQGAQPAAQPAAGPPQFAPAPRPKPPIPVPSGLDLAANARLTGEIAFLVADLDSGAVLEYQNANRPLPPASVAKIPTALYALDRLGPDHRFETRLIASGPRQGGVLSGDLFLQGGGDPELDTVELAELADLTASTGLRRITGRFFIDAGIYPEVAAIDPTQPEAASYNPGVSALNLNFNRVWAEWRRKNNGYSVSMQARAEGLSPRARGFSLRVVGQPRNGQVFDHEITGDGEAWTVRNKALGRAGGRFLPVRQPPFYTGEVFRGLAAERGLALPEVEPAAAPLLADVIARRESRTLAEITRDMLDFSTNLTAEALGLAATKSSGGAADSLAGSAGAMNAWAAGFIGAPPGDPGLDLKNHSGLSADSRMTALRLVELLIAADRRGFPALQGGRAVTLGSLLEERSVYDEKTQPPFLASVRAKTGTLNFVSALAGYITVETGRRLAFAILVADLPRRSATFDPSTEIPVGSGTWNARARGLQAALARSWIARFGR